MLKRYILLLWSFTIFTFYNIPIVNSGNFKKLENAAEDYSNWINQKISFTKDEINYSTNDIFSLNEIDEDRIYIEKYSDKDSFVEVYNQISNPILIIENNPSINYFFNICQQIFNEADNHFNLFKQSAVHMLLEKTIKKIEEKQIYKREFMILI